MIDLFYDQREIDSFIAANLYGGYGGDTPYNHMQYENFHYVDMAKLNPSQGSSIGSPQSIAERKMSPFETYIALIKGYCVILILILPKAFAEGGYMASAILLVMSGIFSAGSACLLAEAGLKENLYSYSLLVHKAFGPTGKLAVDIMISLAQYSFTISHIAFIIESL